jgi:activator of HSP90 ATPase
MSQIHQEITFDFAPPRVYRALLDAGEFAAFTGAPAEIGSREGDAFLYFGDLVMGRIVQLVPDRRIVLAWRVFNWPEGAYSIARFELKPVGSGTLLVFDQDGVPDGDVKHVDQGWGHKYWEPLRKHLAGASGPARRDPAPTTRAKAGAKKSR